MAEQRQTFERLSSPLIHLIFDYLSPAEIHCAFRRLNRRFTKIIHEHRFALPSSDEMSFELYRHYLTKILPRYASRFEHLHLSERSSAHAISWFLSQVPLNKSHWPRLKSLTIDDIPAHLLRQLTTDCTLMENIETLSLDVDHARYHHDEYQNSSYAEIFVAILNKCRKLRQFELNFASLPNDEDLRRMAVHRHLQKLTMMCYSTDFMVELLTSGCLQALEHLDVSLFGTDAYVCCEPRKPPSIDPSALPHLRRVTVREFMNVTWILALFEKLQQQNQLKRMKIKGWFRVNLYTNFPRASALKRWLFWNQSNDYQFHMELVVDYRLEAEGVQKEILNDYRNIFGKASTPYGGSLFIDYPTMESFDQTSQIQLRLKIQTIEPMMKELKFFEFTDDDELEIFKTTPWWPLLKRIVLRGVYFMSRDSPDENLPILIRIVQRAPNLRQLKVECDSEYATEFASDSALGQLLVDRLDIFEIEGYFDKLSLDDLVQFVFQSFGHSSRPARLKHLSIRTSQHPKDWFTTKELIRHTRRILAYFPSLTHFKLFHCSLSSSRKMPQTINEFHRDQWIYSVLPDRCVNRWVNYRCKAHSLEIWL